MVDKQYLSIKVPVSRLSVLKNDSKSFEIILTDAELSEIAQKKKELIGDE